MTARASRIDLATWDKPIDGVKEISQHCTAYAGVEISVHQVRRLIRRKYLPIPAKGIGHIRKRWVITDLLLFAEWLRREFGE